MHILIKIMREILIIKQLQSSKLSSGATTRDKNMLGCSWLSLSLQNTGDEFVPKGCLNDEEKLPIGYASRCCYLATSFFWCFWLFLIIINNDHFFNLLKVHKGFHNKKPVCK